MKDRQSKTNKLSRWALTLFFLIAGINHFVMPEVYITLIPPYFSYPEFINFVSGIAEILLGLGLIWQKTRTWAAYGLIILLIAFIPAHIYIFELDAQINDFIYIPDWVAWVRLIIIHPLLLRWIWTNRK